MIRANTFARRVGERQFLSVCAKHAVLEGGDHRVVHVALAANRRRIGEILGGRADGLQHLLVALALVCRGLGARERFEHARRGQQRTKVLQ
jgi:hypothetical protein